MNGQEYEKFCARWLAKHGYHDVSLTRATGDQGIDILAFRHGKQYGFQCKYYDRPVGNEAVQQAYAGAAFYDCDIPAVITNSTFTRAARQLAGETDVILMEQIDPDTPHHLFSLIQILSIIISFAGIFSFSQYSQHPLMPFNDRSVWADLALITGGLAGLYAGSHLFLCLLAAVLDLSYLLLDLPVLRNEPDLFHTVFWCLVLILCGTLFIHLIRMLRKRNRRNARRLRREIHQAISEEVNELGRHLETLLSEELQCSLSLQSAEHKADGTSTFVFHSSRDVHEDLPVLEYSLNQYAKHDQTNDVYAFTMESSRRFTLVIRHRPDA